MSENAASGSSVVAAKVEDVKRDDVPVKEAPRKGSMAPPYVPSSPRLVSTFSFADVEAALIRSHRMTRMPSLQQISDRLHLPSPLSTQPPSTTNIDGAAPSPTETTPSKPKLAINPNVPGAITAGSPYTSSPSGRLKLPASAMMRSHSSGSTVPTLASASSPTRRDAKDNGSENGLWNTSDPFASPVTAKSAGGIANGANGGESMSRGPSREGYIKGYKDVPSLSAIRERMGSARQSISEGPTEGVPPPKLAQHAQQDKPVPDSVPAAVPMAQRISNTTTVSDSASHSTINSSTSASSTSTSPEIVIDSRKAEHSLRHAWTLFFDAKSFVPPSEMVTPKEGQGFLGDYEKSLVTVGKFDTVCWLVPRLGSLD